MEHSVQKYLDRQSTEKLEIALQDYLRQPMDRENERILRLIVEILEKRGVAFPASKMDEGKV